MTDSEGDAHRQLITLPPQSKEIRQKMNVLSSLIHPDGGRIASNSLTRQHAVQARFPCIAMNLCHSR